MSQWCQTTKDRDCLAPLFDVAKDCLPPQRPARRHLRRNPRRRSRRWKAIAM
jgi:hypothetical protein